MTTSRAALVTMAVVAAMSWTRTAPAQPAPPDVTSDEYSCMKVAAEVGGKYVYARTKCVLRCVKQVWRGDGSDTDCHPPYGGKTALCLARAEQRFARKFTKDCDPTIDADNDCPECYSGGDCSAAGEATNRANLLAAETDAFFEGFFCERAGASKLEQRCQQTTAKSIAKLYGARLECFTRCFNVTRDGNPPMSECLPPPTYLPTDTCLTNVAVPYLDDIDERCAGPSEAPDACSGAYPSASAWDNLSRLWLYGDVFPTYCSE